MAHNEHQNLKAWSKTILRALPAKSSKLAIGARCPAHTQPSMHERLEATCNSRIRLNCILMAQNRIYSV